ncbi:DUF5808 domain-containing protein [Corynebacterium breve]|uniref:DUF5808 domain-containing protein n=1 Tax=Corynebacterium breve TaxID=3049799 RepID=A0ABY8VFN5_9CORY|nr:DUF5808 domain-containing protein [Corynebacterium breve]WIM67776.1 DUF5808 domain-containing protein [Corynebacterium breve]
MNRYLEAIAAALREQRMPRRQIDSIVAEHRSLIDDLLATDTNLTDELGAPEVYAAEVAAGIQRREPQLLGFVPVNLLGAFSRDSRRKMWDPQDPRVLQPHQLGIGWSINWGAVAVKLGLIQPDDIDHDVIASIPRPALRAAQAVPAVVTAAQGCMLVRRWRSLPDSVHTQWAMDGTPKGARCSKNALSLSLFVSAVATAAALIPAMRGDREDSLNAASLASVAAGITTGQLAGAVAEAGGDERAGNTALGVILGSLVASVAVITAPIFAGLRAVWRREGVA